MIHLNKKFMSLICGILLLSVLGAYAAERSSQAVLVGNQTDSPNNKDDESWLLWLERMEEMNRRIEDLRKSIDELREKRLRLKAAPKLNEGPGAEKPAPKKKPGKV